MHGDIACGTLTVIQLVGYFGAWQTDGEMSSRTLKAQDA